MTSPAKSMVYFYYETPVNIRNRAVLKKFIEGLFKKEGYKLKNLNYIFCTDKRLLDINKQFLSHNYYTDIITFPLSEAPNPIEGEIYISIDRVKENAMTEKEPLNRELLRVIFHGALHLCGYTDKTKREKEKIREREDFYINKYMRLSSSV
ncbi:MAG: rRNA maturation RNase YbeY [Chitinophagaceae bacterium]